MSQTRDPRPIAIYDTYNTELYYSSSIEVQDKWNEYAQNRANIFNEEHSPDRDTRTVYKWTPDLDFCDWKVHKPKY